MVVQKAGTILVNLHTSEIALVYREKQKDYSFPKGHLEPGETLAECAVRETEEETGRQNHLLLGIENFPLSYTTLNGEKAQAFYYLAIDDGPTSKTINESDKEVLYWAHIDEVESVLTYDNLKNLWKRFLPAVVRAIESKGTLTPGILTDLGICPTCYDKEHNHSLYGDSSSKMLYEDSLFECFLVR